MKETVKEVCGSFYKPAFIKIIGLSKTSQLAETDFII